MFIAAGFVAASKALEPYGAMLVFPAFYTARYTGGAIETTMAHLPTYNNDMPFTYLKVK